jgi:hypothetical protein
VASDPSGGMRAAVKLRTARSRHLSAELCWPFAGRPFRAVGACEVAVSGRSAKDGHET